VQRYVYSYEFYRRLYLTARFRLWSSADERQRIASLATADNPLTEQNVADSPQQTLTPLERFDDREVDTFVCAGQPFQADATAADAFRARVARRDPALAPWLDAVRELQQLGSADAYRLLFFVNMAPKICPGADRFYDAGALSESDALLDVLGDGVPAVSSAREFLHDRPSQMPAAGGHSVGNANVVKADVLFRVLSDRMLPSLPGRPPSRRAPTTPEDLTPVFTCVEEIRRPSRLAAHEADTGPQAETRPCSSAA